MASTTATSSVTQDYTNILFRSGSTAEISSWASLIDSGVFTAAQVTNAFSTSYEATTFVDPIVRIYQTAFNRAPESSAILTAWVQAYKSGAMTLTQISNSFIASSEFATKFGSATPDNTAFVSAMYQNALGRTGSAAEIQAWVGAMTGTGALTQSQVLQAFTTSAEFVNASATTIATWLQTYGTSNTYVASISIGSHGGGASGSTFTLTTGTDVVTGTAGNDTIVGDWGATTVNASDQINGGTGTDTLKVYGTLGTLPASVTGVEIVDLVNPGTNAITDTTLLLPAGLTKLQIEQAGAVAGTVTTTSLSGLQLQLGTLNNAAATGALTWTANATDTALSLELSGYQGAAAAGAYTAVTVGGTAHTTFNLISDTAANKVSTLTDATATTINITASSALTIDMLSAVADKSLVITGTGNVTISASDLAATVTVDASAATGNVAYTAEAAGSTLTFKGGSGNDSVTFAAGTLTTADVLTGGTGTDTLIINDTALATTANLAGVNAASGFEVLGLATTGATLDVSLLTNGITGFKVLAGNLTETFTNSLATSTYTIDNSASNTGTVSIGNKVGELSTSVTVDYGSATAAKTLANLTLSGATTVSLVSTGTGTGGSNIITTLANADNSVITITGSKDLTITNAIAGVTTGSKIDASAFTGKLGIIGSGQADIITGGSGADTINGGAGKDTINGGAGNDTIVVSTASQADVLTGGAGADTFKFTGDNTTLFATSTGTSDIVSITDFVAGTDKIAIASSTAAFTSVTLATQTIATAADLTAVWAGISAVAASASGGAASAVLVTVSAGAAAGTYLYVNDTTAAVSNTADLLVKLTGITGTLATTDFTFA